MSDADESADGIFADKSTRRMRIRGVLGVTGVEDKEPFRHAMSRHQAPWYPVLALSALVMVADFQSQAMFVISPEISRSLGVSPVMLSAAVLFKTIAVTVAGGVMAAYTGRVGRRAAVTVITAFAWSVMSFFTGFVINIAGLVVVLVLDGISAGSVLAVHPPLLMDSYPPGVRARCLTFYRGAQELGQIVAPLAVGAMTALLGFTWRGVFVAAGVTCFLVSIVGIRLRDPGTGRHDTARARAVLQGRVEASEADLDAATRLGFFEASRRLLLIPTVRRMLMVQLVEGMLTAPLLTYLFFFLDDRWGMGPGPRSVLYALAPIAAMPTLAWFAHRAEAMFKQDPAKIVRLESLFLFISSGSLAVLVLAPQFALMIAAFIAFFASVAVLAPADNILMLSIVPAAMRPHLAALKGIFVSGIGGMAGLVLLSGLDRPFGLIGAIGALSVPGVIAGLMLRSVTRTINADMDRMIDEIVEEGTIAKIKQDGGQLPLLACRKINAAYGQVQVLFDVDFDVAEGEMIGLLGTNGAGKTTLLKVMSGLVLPRSGSLYYRGRDVTYLNAERRVGLGMSQIAGGQAVFGPMSVTDNLRMFGYTERKRRHAVDAGIEASFAMFPQLARDRNRRASELSGGEQQMLALSKALILAPRLLLIDELSLGLSPTVVSQLLRMVRQINASGTAVVLVEQSVNVALSLVDRCYFMEKGTIRFQGAATALIGRTDLLRSVFLTGASAALADETR